MSNETPLVQLVKANDGKIYRVSDDQEVTRESLTDTVGKAQQLLAKAQENLHQYDLLTAPKNETPTQDPAPTPETPAETPVETPAESAPVETPAPEQPVPAEPTLEEATPLELATELKEDLEAPVAPEAPAAPVAEQPAAAPIADVTPAPTPETPTESPVPQPIEVQ